MVLEHVTATDPMSVALTRLVASLTEEAIFEFSATRGQAEAALEGLGKRRADAHAAAVRGEHVPRMVDYFDRWLVELSRAIAPIAAPVWMPMAGVIDEKVTLEIGARGIRSLFSSKPSDKDIQRVKKLGTLAVRVLRAVLAADGPIDTEEARTIAALVSSLGLPDVDAAPLYTEAPVSLDQLDVYGELDPHVVRALVAGAWLAAAWDALDPREETAIRTLAKKFAFDANELETLRTEAIRMVDAARVAGLATVDAVRFILFDRIPGVGVQLAANAGTLMLPRRFREEALAQVGHGTQVVLAKRYPSLSVDERAAVLGIAWAAALHDDPSVGRRSLLRARHDRVALDLGDDGARIRYAIDEWVAGALAPVAFTMTNAALGQTGK